MSAETGAFQRAFHERWNALRDPHVRSLAWLLEAPNLLDAASPRWQGKIAALDKDAGHAVHDWLLTLDHEPTAFHTFLDVHALTRLGRYAEKLLAWYFMHRQCLHAYGLQVRSGKNETLGEFDFLLRQEQGLVHWEFATKFYLLCSANPAYAQLQQADYFVGPNLADTLGAKMRKILDRQLALGEHPVAQEMLKEKLCSAQALVKGWLFYRREEPVDAGLLGISADHCRGWWCTLAELDDHVGGYGMVLPRLSWLAPARVPAVEAWSRDRLRRELQAHFSTDVMPVMVASLKPSGADLLETDRGFVVPDSWQSQAQAKVQGLVRDLTAPPG